MLESMRRGQRWLTLFLVSVIGVVFVFFLGTGGNRGSGTPSGNAIVQLDDVRLSLNDYGRMRDALQQQLQEQIGPDAELPPQAQQLIDTQALAQMRDGLVRATAAKELGLQVTTDEIRRTVQAIPFLIDEEGRFDPKRFDDWAQREYGSQRAFMDVLTRDLLGQKLIQLLVSQVAVSDAEIDLALRYELEEVSLAYLALDELQLPAGESVSDEEVEAYAKGHEAELQKLFGEREADLSKPERVRAHHLLIAAASGAPEADAAAARAKLEAARTRLLAGEDFEKIVQELSADPTAAAQGGDLGEVARGTLDPALDEAVFALEPGALSEVLRSSYGFHVVRVDEKLPAEKATFEAHRLALAREGATRERATARADEQSKALAEAVRGGKTLEDAAREAGLTLERPAALKRSPDGFVPGLGAAGEILNKAFTLKAGESSPEVFDLADKRVMIQVIDRTPLAEERLATERATRRDQALAEKQNAVVQAWIEDYRTRLINSGRLLINTDLAIGS